MTDSVVGVVGDLVQDVIAILASEVEPAGQVDATLSRHRGGSAANVAACLSVLGVDSRLYGRVGYDGLGDELIRALALCGVDIRARRRGVSATVICLVDRTGERSFVADPAAVARGRSTGDLPLDELRDLDALHISGYWLLGGVDIEPLVRTFESGRPFLTIDLGNVSRVRAVGSGHVQDILRALKPDVLVANRLEATAACVLERPALAEVCIVTDGPGPTTVLKGNRTSRIPVRPVPNVIDTTGAGDAFIAGFLASSLNGISAEESVVAGHKLSSMAIQRVGAGFADFAPS